MKPQHPEKLKAVVEHMVADPDLSYRAACAKAGISYRTAYRHLGKLGRRSLAGRKNKVPRECMIAALQVFKAVNGRSPVTTDFYKGMGVSHMTIYREFGSWDAALEAAGLEPIRWRERGLPAKMKLTANDLRRKKIA